MSTPERVYLDNAATSWPKPVPVYAAVDETAREIGAAAGRGSYGSSSHASRTVNDARRVVARFLRAENPQRIAFGFNGTDVLNMAMQGVLRQSGHVVTTAAEHNSVLRPLQEWQGRYGGKLTIVPCDDEGLIDVAEFRKALRPDTMLAVITHASNVTGTLQPIADLSTVCKERESLVLIDAAQTLGHEPFDVGELPVDLVAAPGHKALLGPLGTGVLYVRPGIEERLASFRQGGTGTISDSIIHPTDMPELCEAGNHNVPGLAGLAAGVEWISQRGLAELRSQQQGLIAQLIDGLSEAAGVRLFGPREASRRVGVVSFVVDGHDPQEVAAMLDSHYGIEARSGLHCAPLIHKAIGTLPLGGTVRFSVGPYTTGEQMELAISAVAEIAAATMDV